MSGDQWFKRALNRKEQIAVLMSRFETLAEVHKGSKTGRDIWRHYRTRHAIRLAETLNPIIESI